MTLPHPKGSIKEVYNTLAGALVSAFLSDRFGRKHLLTFSGLLFAGSSIGAGMAG